MWFLNIKEGGTEEWFGGCSHGWSVSMWQVRFHSNKKGGTDESCGDCSQGWDYQCDECNLAICCG